MFASSNATRWLEGCGWHENIDAYFPDLDAPHPGPVPKQPKVAKEKKPSALKPKAKPKQVALKKPAVTDVIGLEGG